MSFDSAGLEILPRAECFRLLESAAVGRIVFTDNALPAVQPVTFALFDNQIIIRTASHSKLAAAAGSVVAFEADAYDDGRGWSVTAIGRVRAVTDPGERRELTALSLRAWGTTVGDQWLATPIEMIQGRRIPESYDPEANNGSG